MIYMYMLTSFADCFQIQLEWIEWTFWLVANSQKLMHKNNTSAKICTYVSIMY